MSNSISREPIQIVGAGPAGLAAAITLARAGRRVVVHEAAAEVGSRFQGDHQGLENWTTERDVLDEFREHGLACEFERTPCRHGVTFDAWGHRYEFHSESPLFYTIERGPGRGTVDTAQLAQARGLGVEVRFGSRIRQIEGPAILAAGPRAADAIAAGFHFETSMSDGWWAICDDDLAPQGYAYALVANGQGTVKTCMFSGFKRETEYVARMVGRFRNLIGLEMKNPQPHGALGNAGYRRFLRRASASGDARRFLHQYYGPSWLKRLLYPWARLRVQSRRRDVTCNHVDCSCVWCRCGGAAQD